MRFEVLDILTEMPFAAAVRVSENAAWLAGELLKVEENPTACKTNHLFAAGFFYSHKEVKIVSRKKRTGSDDDRMSKASNEGGDALRWLNARIPDEIVGDVERLASDTSSLCVKFLAYTAAGADCLVKRKRGSVDWLAMLTFDDPYVTGGRCAITGWGNNPVDAVASVVAKFELVLGGTIPEPVIQGSDNARRFG